MKIRQKFAFYNLILLLTPILLIGVVSVIFLFLFVLKFPVEEFSINRASLLNPVIMVQSFGSFFQKHPESIIYVFLWFLISIIIIALTSTIVTRIMTKSIEVPISTLSVSVDNIKSNNLNFEIMGSDYDEINSLCEGFDKMRQNLIAAKVREDLLQKEQKLLIANISHDLKTPITAIKGYIEGINDGVADTPEKMNKYLSTIQQKTEVIENLVNNLSTLSKLEKNAPDFEFKSGDIRELLFDVLDSYRIDFEENGITLKTQIPKYPLNVRIDGKKMKRVFSNIIENSIKYKREESREFTVKAFSEEGHIYIKFIDDGSGIAPAEIDKVFDNFYRGDSSRTSQIQGNGLGLGIAKSIIAKHKGRIWLNSEGTGKGTTVTISLQGE